MGSTELSCNDACELIANDLDRELTVTMKRRLRGHLDSCEACRREAVSLARSVRVARDVARPESAAQWFAERTLDRLLTEFEADGGCQGSEEPVEDSGQLELWR